MANDLAALSGIVHIVGIPEDTDLGPVEAGVAVLVHGKQGCVDVIPVLVSRDQKRADILSIDFPVNTVAEKVVK